MNLKYCKDCFYFEERRDIDKVVLCRKGHRPNGFGCPDFEDKLNKYHEICQKRRSRYVKELFLPKEQLNDFPNNS